ncbi:hypothetical protein [Saccharopolyspora mangrovi]|uniref:Uncharacterized protein n=1 Tax=Saccharopolyspora mangrovi TaxID=3082379 RepID=A0ABU6A775_9PSEU|nr:hypothetical protein [Saccharopolyspora sp. S2-29]MEB3367378.1 hypothetical protein [Saccharopolyspora sp. S2-29]
MNLDDAERIAAGILRETILDKVQLYHTQTVMQVNPAVNQQDAVLVHTAMEKIALDLVATL